MEGATTSRKRINGYTDLETGFGHTKIMPEDSSDECHHTESDSTSNTVLWNEQFSQLSDFKNRLNNSNHHDVLLIGFIM